MILAGTFVREQLDNAGYLPHTRPVMVRMPSDWLPGETKPCLVRTNSAMGLHQAGYAYSELECDELSQLRQVDATFYGREFQPQYRQVQWYCQRVEASLVCREPGFGNVVRALSARR